MNYTEAIDYIHSTLKFGSKLGLKNISTLLDLMGNPHKKLKFVHVAGTNGKGSTVAFISSILMEAGYKTGIFTSPYIQRFTERIKVGSIEIGEDDLARITGFVKDKVDIMVSQGCNHPTEFEIVTAIAFQYYFECNCDIVVLEVGLGGRFDSTNVIDPPLAAVITTINYDHMDRLGDTIAKIAFEKAGIIKSQSDVVLYPQMPEAEEVFERACEERGAVLHKVSFDGLKAGEYSIDGQSFDFDGYKDLSISLLGKHQICNAAVAVRTAEILAQKGFCIDEGAIRRGLKKARWPARFELVNRNPLFVVDGAHNAEGANTLKDALNQYFPEKRKTFIFGVLGDKDFKSIIEIIAPIANRFVAVTPKSDRALPARELAIVLADYCKDVAVSDTIEEAIKMTLDASTDQDVICAFGSLYYVGQVRDYFGLS